MHTHYRNSQRTHHRNSQRCNPEVHACLLSPGPPSCNSRRCDSQRCDSRRWLIVAVSGVACAVFALTPLAWGQSAKPRLPANQSRQANVAMLLTTEVVSETPHDSLAAARRDALQRAQQAVAAFLREQDPPIHWTPSLEFIEQLVTSVHHEQQDLRDDPSFGCIMYRERLAVRLTEADLYRIILLERDHRSEQRMLLLARIVAVIVVLTGTVSLYIQLDDWTRGFMTVWLRTIAVILAAAGVAVIVLVK